MCLYFFKKFRQNQQANVSYHCETGIQIKGQVLFKGEINAKVERDHFETLLKNQQARKAQICIKASDIVQIQVFHGPRGTDGVKIGNTIFTCVLCLKKKSPYQQANFNQSWCNASLGK
jgi:hypothetical protein